MWLHGIWRLRTLQKNTYPLPANWYIFILCMRIQKNRIFSSRCWEQLCMFYFPRPMTEGYRRHWAVPRLKGIWWGLLTDRTLNNCLTLYQFSTLFLFLIISFIFNRVEIFLGPFIVIMTPTNSNRRYSTLNGHRIV